MAHKHGEAYKDALGKLKLALQGGGYGAAFDGSQNVF
jgi:hypothetical protein